MHPHFNIANAIATVALLSVSVTALLEAQTSKLEEEEREHGERGGGRGGGADRKAMEFSSQNT
jgi:hypothetical protein